MYEYPDIAAAAAVGGAVMGSPGANCGLTGAGIPTNGAYGYTPGIGAGKDCRRGRLPGAAAARVELVLDVGMVEDPE